MQEQFMNKSMVIILEVLKASVDVDVQIHLLNVFKILARNGKYTWDAEKYVLERFTSHVGRTTFTGLESKSFFQQ